MRRSQILHRGGKDRVVLWGVRRKAVPLLSVMSAITCMDWMGDGAIEHHFDVVAFTRLARGPTRRPQVPRRPSTGTRFARKSDLLLTHDL